MGLLSKKSDLKKLFIIIFLVSFSSAVFASLNFSNQSATVHIAPGTGKLILTPAVTNWDGTLYQEGAVSGSRLAFDGGILRVQDTPAFFRGTYDSSGAQQIVLGGNQTLSVQGGAFNDRILVTGTGNILRGQLAFANDTVSVPNIELQNSSAALSLAVQGKLTSFIALNGGSVTLNDDIDFGDGKRFLGTGVINLNKKRVMLGGSDINMTETVYWNDATDIILNSRTTLSGMWIFNTTGTTEDAHITGNGNILDLGTTGTIRVRSGTTLYMTDIKLKGLGNGNGSIIFDDKTSRIRTSQTEIELSNNYSVTTGGFYVEGTTRIVTRDKNLTFALSGTLTVDGITLDYDTTIFGDKKNIVPAGRGASTANIALLNNGVITPINSLSQQNSNALLYGDRTNSNALLYGDRTNSNALLYGLRVNSNAIVAINAVTGGLAKETSNALLYCCRTNSAALVYGLRVNSNALLYGDRTNSNALLYGDRTNSNALLYGINNNSNAIIKNTVDIRTNSNALLYGLRVNSNALLYGDRTNSDALIYGIKNNSNAIIKNTDDIRTNSNALLYGLRVNSNALLYGDRTNSNALLYSDRTNSAALVYGLKNLSNALLYGDRTNSDALIYGIKNNSNAIIKNTDDIRTNSNALLYGLRVNSNALLYGDRTNSNALLYSDRTNSAALAYGLKNLSNALLYGDRTNSNALLYSDRTNSAALAYGLKNLSNALLYGDRTNSDALIYGIKNNSNAIIKNTDDIRTDSNALLYGLRVNSNAIVAINAATGGLAKETSNALLYCCRTNSAALVYGLRVNSNALLYGDRTNSNAIVSGGGASALSRQNSNALIYGIKNNSNAIVSGGGASALSRQNSNAINYLTMLDQILTNTAGITGNLTLSRSQFIQPGEAFLFKNSVTVNGGNTVQVFSDPTKPQFILEPGVTVELNNVILSKIYSSTFKFGQNSTLIIGANVVFELDASVTLNSGRIKIGTGPFIIRGIGGVQKLNLAPTSRQPMIDLNGQVLMLENIELDGLQYITGNNGVILLAGNSTVHIAQDTNMNFDIEGDDNKFVVEANNVALQGALVFGSGNIAENTVHISIRPSNLQITDLGIIFADNYIFLGSGGPGRASLIFDDFAVAVNNAGANAFVTWDNAYLGGQNILIGGFPIKQTAFDLILDPRLVLQGAPGIPNAIDTSFIRFERKEPVHVTTLRKKVKRALQDATRFFELVELQDILEPQDQDSDQVQELTRAVKLSDKNRKVKKENKNKNKNNQAKPKQEPVQQKPEKVAYTLPVKMGRFVVPTTGIVSVTCQLDQKEANGNYAIKDGALTDFGVGPAQMTLYMTGNAALVQGDDTTLKVGDTINIDGINNKISITKNFTIAGQLVFNDNAVLTFEFDDRIQAPVLNFADNGMLNLPDGARLEFDGNGTVNFGDDFVITFGHTQADPTSSTSASIVISDAAKFSVGKNMIVSGKGKIRIEESGYLFVPNGGDLSIGQDPADSFDILVKDGTLGLYNPQGTAHWPTLELNQGEFTVDISQGGLLYVDNGILTMNAGFETGGKSNIRAFRVRDDAIMQLDHDGQLIAWRNSDYFALKPLEGSPFDWDFLRGRVDGRGIATFKTYNKDKSLNANLSGRLHKETVIWQKGPATALEFIRSLINKRPSLLVTTVFDTPGGGQRILMWDHVTFVDLYPGDQVLSDDLAGNVWGVTKDGYQFVIDRDGQRE